VSGASHLLTGCPDVRGTHTRSGRRCRSRPVSEGQLEGGPIENPYPATSCGFAGLSIGTRFGRLQQTQLAIQDSVDGKNVDWVGKSQRLRISEVRVCAVTVGTGILMHDLRSRRLARFPVSAGLGTTYSTPNVNLVVAIAALGK